VQGGLTFEICQILVIYSVSYFNLGRLGALFGGITHQSPSGDGTENRLLEMDSRVRITWADWNKIVIKMVWKKFVVIRAHEIAYCLRYKVWEGVRYVGKILPGTPG